MAGRRDLVDLTLEQLTPMGYGLALGVLTSIVASLSASDDPIERESGANLADMLIYAGTIAIGSQAQAQIDWDAQLLAGYAEGDQ